MDASFRCAGEADFDALSVLVGEFHAESGYAFDVARVREALRALLADPALGRVWLVYSAGSLAGYGALTLGWSLEWGGRDAFVDEIFLRPAFRGRGLGAATLARLEVGARELGVRALHLEVEHDNAPARRLYRRRGFAETDRQIMTLRL
jgi:ribosomal protein S18 acetylase RimI-like enzyme